MTDVELRNAVAGLRGLGRAGIETVALAHRRAAAGSWSRYAAGREITPAVLDDPAGFAEAVGRIAAREGPLVVYPGREEALDALLANPPAPAARLPYPGPDALHAIRSKPAVAERAAEAGLGAPDTIAVATAAELLADLPPTPCVVKESRPGGALERVYVAEDARELRALLESFPTGQELLIQEQLSGPLLAVCLVIDRGGAVVAAIHQRARRTWPAAAGPSSLAISVPEDRALTERCAATLAGAGYWGLAELQFIGSPEGPRLIDVNPRFYGSLPLALACGVNLPAAWHAVATDGEPPVRAPYPAGVTYRWLEADLSATLQGVRGRLAPVRGPRAGAMWAGDDPVPSMLMAARMVTGRTARSLSRAT